MEFAENLRYLRNLTQYTQKQLADFLGLSANCVCEWEKGRSEPSISTIRKLAAFFDVSADYLLGLEDETGARVPAASTTAPPAVPKSSEESKLLEIYNSLSPDLKEMLWGILGTWNPAAMDSIPQKKHT